ncbi:MAG TPA: GNAT family N-acetyltransferase [Actinomycetota bacterium]
MIRLPQGFSARPATMDDAGSITELIAASERHHTGVANIDVEDVRTDFAPASVDLAKDTVLVFEDDALAAEGFVFAGRYANCTVHPDFEGRGLGTALLRWSQEVARRQGGTSVGGTVPDENDLARRLFLDNGYEIAWDSWILEIRHDDPPPEPALPPGYAIRAFEPAEARVVHDVIEGAFSEWEGRPPTPFEDWSAWALDRNGFEPWMIPVVVGEGEIVGAAYLIHYPNDTGWVQQIAVRKDHRRRGLGRALLEHAVREFSTRGERVTGLSTDSRTGARTLYEHVGMTVTHSYTHFATTLER